MKPASQAYASGRKAATIHKAMDKAMASWLVIRICVDTTDKRCVYLDVVSDLNWRGLIEVMSTGNLNCTCRGWHYYDIPKYPDICG